MKNSYKAFTGSATTAVATGNVMVHTLIIPKTTAGTVTLVDTAGSPATYYAFPASTIAGSYILDCEFGNGLQIVTSGADTGLVTISQ